MLDAIPPFSAAEALPSGLWSRAQTTLACSFERVGIGLHTGAETTVRVYPAPIHTGRYFVRTDLPDHPPIPAQIAAVQQTQLSTELVAGSARIRTVEHLLAALAGMGIDNVRIEVNGAELPLLDGSAQDWVESIAIAGLEFQDADRQPTPQITQPIWVTHGDAFVAALPSSVLRFTYGIEFQEVAIGKQWHSWTLVDNSFATDIAPARTFGLTAQIEALRSQGLIQGGSLENALVCDGDGWVNPPLRFENEPVRHKLLDLLGDLSLLGQIPQAHFLAYKASHQLHTQLAAAILTQAFTNAH